MSDDLIDPDAIPLPISLTNLILLESAADSLKEDGEAIAERAHDIKSSWSGLQSFYQAPEAETLFAVLDSVPADGEDVESALSTVSGALLTFTERARELREEMVSLKIRAHTFLASIEGDGDWDKGGLLGGESPKVAEHNELLAEATRIQTDYMEAERDCANTITALFGGPVFVGMNADGSDPPSGNEIGYGFSETPAAPPSEWGSPQGTDHPWYVDVGHAGGDWVAGAAVDLAGATGLYYEGEWGVPVVFGPLATNPWTNPQGTANAQNYGQDTALGLMYLSGFYTGEAPPEIEAERDLVRGSFAWELDGWTMPSSFEEWKGNAGPYWNDLVEGALRLDEWEERPGFAATQIALDAGAGGGALKALRELNAAGNIDLDANRADTSPMDGTPGFGDHPQSESHSPTDFGELAEQSTDSDTLASLDSTLEELAAHQNGSPTGPPADPPTVNDAPAPSQEAPDRPADVSNTDAPEANETPSPAPADAPEHAGAPERDDAENDVPGPTTRQAEEELLLAEMVRNDPGLRETLENIELDLPERVDSMDPDAPWTASPIREPEMAMAGTSGSDGGGGSDPVDTPIGDTHTDASSSGWSSDPQGSTSGPSGDLDFGGTGGRDTPIPPDAPEEPGSSETNQNGHDTLDRPPPFRHEEVINPGHELVQGRRTFAEGVESRLKPDTRYEVTNRHNGSTDYFYTNSEGEIKYVVTERGANRAGNPELVNPRKEAVYKVVNPESGSEYFFETNESSRTEVVEAELKSGFSVRNAEQTSIGHEGRDYFSALNGDSSGTYVYDEVRWNGGHLLSGSEAGGTGERINVIPMLQRLNQYGGTSIANNYRRFELFLDGLLDFNNDKNSNLKKALSGSPNREEQIAQWKEFLNNGPSPPEVRVRIQAEYPTEMPVVKDPQTGRKLPPPPKRIIVQWSVNGVDQPTMNYNNHPDRELR